MSTTVETDVTPNLDQAIADATIDSIGIEAATALFREQLDQAEAEQRRHAETPASFGGLQGWIEMARQRIREVDRLEAITDYLAWRAAGSVEEQPSLEPIDEDDVSKMALRAAISQGEPSPVLLVLALQTVEAVVRRREERVRAIGIQIADETQHFRDGRFNVDHRKLTTTVRTLVPERAELVKQIEADHQALDHIRGYLADHAGEALGDLDAVAASLHSLAAMTSSKDMASDPELKRLTAELAGATSKIDALGFGGKLAASVKGDELTTAKKEIERTIAARRRAIFAEIGRESMPLAKQAASGDPGAIEAIVLEALRDPSCFAKGFARGLLDLQAGACDEVASVVLGHIAPKPETLAWGLHAIGGNA